MTQDRDLGHLYTHDSAVEAKQAIRKAYYIQGEQMEDQVCTLCEDAMTGRFFNPSEPGLAFWVCTEGHVHSTHSAIHNYKPAPEDTRNSTFIEAIGEDED